MKNIKGDILDIIIYLLPSKGIGTLLIVIGILFKYPKFLLRESFSWVIYSLVINIVLISIILSVVFEIIKTKKSYKLLFYFSYYSLTIFLAHNVLHFLFLNQLNVYDIWFFAAGAFFFMITILRAIYKIWDGTASLNVLIGKLSYSITIKIKERSPKKYKKTGSLDI